MACQARDTIVWRELISDSGRIPITISIRSRRRPSLWVACSFDRAGRKVAHVGVQLVVVSVAICDVLPLMNSTEPSRASMYVRQRLPPRSDDYRVLCSLSDQSDITCRQISKFSFVNNYCTYCEHRMLYKLSQLAPSSTTIYLSTVILAFYIKYTIIIAYTALIKLTPSLHIEFF